MPHPELPLKQKEDHAHQRGGEDYEVDYLSHLLSVSPSLVTEAIASAGTNRHKVKEYIRKARQRDGKR
ncbi:MAG: DUF3606 domain-containing protein [Sphingobacteriales bacterium]|nr:MAG: DUF3606 domain-containing protein [Sphingobacteriales bacterium]